METTENKLVDGLRTRGSLDPESEAIKWAHCFAGAALAWIDAGWTDPDLSFELHHIGETPATAEAKLLTWGIEIGELKRSRWVLMEMGLPSLFHLVEFDSKDDFDTYWNAEADWLAVI